MRDISDENDGDGEKFNNVDLLELITAPDCKFQQIFRETKAMDVLFEVATALWRTHPCTSRTSKAYVLLQEKKKAGVHPKKKNRVAKNVRIVSRAPWFPSF